MLPYGGFNVVHAWLALMLYVLCCVLDFCKLNIPVAVLPFATVSERADGKAWSKGVKEPVGAGGGGVAAGGEGGVVEGGGGVVDGGGGVVEGGGGGVALPLARTESETGIRRVCDPLGPLSTM